MNRHRLAGRAGFPDSFPPIPSDVPVPVLDSGPDSRPGNPASSSVSTDETPGSAAVSPGNDNSNPKAVPTAESRLPPAAVAGIAVGSTLVLLSLVVIAWLVVRRRRRNYQVQLDDGAKAGGMDLNLTRPAAAKTTLVVDVPPSISVWPGGGLPSHNDAPPAYEEVALHGRGTCPAGHTAPELCTVVDGFRRYRPSLEVDIKGLKE